jgi:hypothetical protein
MESSKQKLSGGDDKTSVDGGDSYSTYEIGTDLTLSPYKDTGLVAYWRMDEGTGSTTKDDAASNTGTITGATWQTDSNCKRGNCLYFDGTGDYITTSAFSVDPAGTVLTVSGWVKMGVSDSPLHQPIISETKSATVGFILVYRPQSSNALGWQYAEGSDYYELSYNTFFTGYDNTWVHFTIVCDYVAKITKFYRNGELIQTSDMHGIPVFPTINRERAFGGAAMGGNLDDIRIYNRELSASEIKAIYEGTK